MTLLEIVQMVAAKKGLDQDNDYQQRLLTLAKQRARQLWESFDWPERLRTVDLAVAETACSVSLDDIAQFDSVVSIRHVEDNRLLEGRTLADFARDHQVRDTDTEDQNGPTCYALTREAAADSWKVRLDASSGDPWTAQVLYRLTRLSLFEDRDEDEGDILINGAELVLEAWIEADALEMEEQRGTAMQSRALGDQRLGALKTQAKSKPGHQRILPSYGFGDD